MAKPVKEVPPPLEGNDRMIAGIGAAVWAVAFAVVFALSLSGQLSSSRHWWIWTCLTGVGLGLFGVVAIPWIKRGRARTPASPADSRSARRG